jgi:hypothetical protein
MEGRGEEGHGDKAGVPYERVSIHACVQEIIKRRQMSARRFYSRTSLRPNST